MVRDIELFTLDDETIDSIAIVQNPAIGVTFLCFAEDAPKQYFFADDEKHELTGCFLIPELRIPRYDDNGEMYNVYFSADTVKKIAYSFLSNRQMNIAHSQDTDKLVLVESWLKESETDKSVALGLNVPVGSWVGTVKVNDEALWQQIKAGDYRGFSIEGVFQSSKNEGFEAQQDSDEMLLNKIINLIAQWDE